MSRVGVLQYVKIKLNRNGIESIVVRGFGFNLVVTSPSEFFAMMKESNAYLKVILIKFTPKYTELLCELINIFTLNHLPIGDFSADFAGVRIKNMMGSYGIYVPVVGDVLKFGFVDYDEECFSPECGVFYFPPTDTHPFGWLVYGETEEWSVKHSLINIVDITNHIRKEKYEELSSLKSKVYVGNGGVVTPPDYMIYNFESIQEEFDTISSVLKNPLIVFEDGTVISNDGLVVYMGSEGMAYYRGLYDVIENKEIGKIAYIFYDFLYGFAYMFEMPHGVRRKYSVYESTSPDFINQFPIIVEHVNNLIKGYYIAVMGNLISFPKSLVEHVNILGDEIYGVKYPPPMKFVLTQYVVYEGDKFSLDGLLIVGSDKYIRIVAQHPFSKKGIYEIDMWTGVDLSLVEEKTKTIYSNIEISKQNNFSISTRVYPVYGAFFDTDISSSSATLGDAFDSPVFFPTRIELPISEYSVSSTVYPKIYDLYKGIMNIGFQQNIKQYIDSSIKNTPLGLIPEFMIVGQKVLLEKYHDCSDIDDMLKKLEKYGDVGDAKSAKRSLMTIKDIRKMYVGGCK